MWAAFDSWLGPPRPVVFGLLIWWHIPGNSGTVFGVSRREKCCCCCGPSSTFKSKSFSSLVLQGRSERVATSGSTLRRQVSHPLLHTTTMFKYARQLMQHCRAYFKWRKPDHSSDGRLRSQSVQMTGYGPQVDPHKKSPMSMSLDNIPESVSNAMPDISLKDLTDIVHVDMEKDRVMAEEDFRPYSKALSKVQARPSSLRLSPLQLESKGLGRRQGDFHLFLSYETSIVLNLPLIQGYEKELRVFPRPHAPECVKSPWIRVGQRSKLLCCVRVDGERISMQVHSRVNHAGTVCYGNLQFFYLTARSSSLNLPFQSLGIAEGLCYLHGLNVVHGYLKTVGTKYLYMVDFR